MKVHLIWDLDGTLVDSEPEILATIKQALCTVHLSVDDAYAPLRIGPPLPAVLRNSFPKEVLNDAGIAIVIGEFRKIYDASDFENTRPYDGIDEMIKSDAYRHTVITNKPNFAARRLIDKKGWRKYISDVLSPDSLPCLTGRELTKIELFQHFMSRHLHCRTVGIGDMAGDADCAHTVGIPAIGVLWGAGTQKELEDAGCDAIVSDTHELTETLQEWT